MKTVIHDETGSAPVVGSGELSVEKESFMEALRYPLGFSFLMLGALLLLEFNWRFAVGIGLVLVGKHLFKD